MNPSEELRDKRRDLVLAAEKVIKAAFVPGKELALKKTQLNHLIGICGEATCAEEIENYIRYQAGRGSDKTGWDLDLARQVIESMGAAAQGLSNGNRLSAWRLYAVYLTRAFTYEAECRKSRNNANTKGMR